MFAEPEIETLEALVPTLEEKTERQKNPHPVSGLARASWVVARLGGWNCYQTPRTDYFEAGPGAVPYNPPRPVAWIDVGMKMC